ncbi:MAG: DNA methyltransferase, partial [Planctomycetota bacterium]
LVRLSKVKVLDPACGSGNFLYVTLQKLKDLEKEVITYAGDRIGRSYLPLVAPWQLYGIEISPYAFELAQMTLWIGYLQWTRANGFPIEQDPILKPGKNFHLRDAILDTSDPDHPKEPDWPSVDFIVGNPPFLGARLMWAELGRTYAENVAKLYQQDLGGKPDLCCYWFEKARRQIQAGRCKRAGLLATQGIRGGTNRKVLQRIKQTGDIFFAESDRPWILDGANVHVSMVGFDDRAESQRHLDGKPVAAINANLTSLTDTTQAIPLSSNLDTAFQGGIKRGPFDIDHTQATTMLRSAGNPHGLPNSDVIFPYLNGADITRRPTWTWIIDFGDAAPQASASKFVEPFEYVRQNVKPARQHAEQEQAKLEWWLHWRTRPEMNRALRALGRFIATPRVSKHRLFVWQQSPTYPDSAIIVFARSDDYFFGVLHSRIHEVWARAQGTQLRERESGFRYTPTTCFETFPFPEPTEAQRDAIASAAKELNDLRQNWLNPPEWTTTEILEFPGSVNGPWARYIVSSSKPAPGEVDHDPDSRGIGAVRYPARSSKPAPGEVDPHSTTAIGIVRYPRLIPRDPDCASKLKPRTLTNLYNQRPTWLSLAHAKLDSAVFAAYSWPPDLTDDQLLSNVLSLNLAREQKEPQPSIHARRNLGPSNLLGPARQGDHQ